VRVTPAATVRAVALALTPAVCVATAFVVSSNLNSSGGCQVPFAFCTCTNARCSSQASADPATGNSATTSTFAKSFPVTPTVTTSLR
jgi:hypothetical protein